MRRPKRQKPHKIEDNEYTNTTTRWLVTYSDLITLLMAFFVMLYAMSVVNRGKFNRLLLSMRSGFGRKAPQMKQMNVSALAAESSSSDASPSLNTSRRSVNIAPVIETNIRNNLPRSQKEKVQFTTVSGVVKIRVGTNSTPFQRGSAHIRPNARRTLRALAAAFGNLPYRYRIEGHTADISGHGDSSAYEWKLSVNRAVQVLLFLTRATQLSANALSAAGYADTRPVLPHPSSAQRYKNDRIEIAVLRKPQKQRAPAIVSGIRPPEPNVRPPAVRLVPNINYTLKNTARLADRR